VLVTEIKKKCTVKRNKRKEGKEPFGEKHKIYLLLDSMKASLCFVCFAAIVLNKV